MPGTDPYPMFASPWVPAGGPSQNIPLDQVPGINNYGLTSVSSPIPFWDPPLTSLDPSNSFLPVWDVVKLSGQQLPGLCAVTGGRPKRFDVKKVKGQNFATLTSNGYDPAHLKIIERIWTPQQWYALQLVMPILEPLFPTAPNAASEAVEIRHPALALRNIHSVCIQNITIIAPTPGTHGCWQQEIECIEYKPVRKTQNVTTTPVGSAQFARSSPNSPMASYSPAPAPLSSAADWGPNGATQSLP
jgi:hypothetical protein